MSYLSNLVWNLCACHAHALPALAFRPAAAPFGGHKGLLHGFRRENPTSARCAQAREGVVAPPRLPVLLASPAIWDCELREGHRRRREGRRRRRDGSCPRGRGRPSPVHHLIEHHVESRQLLPQTAQTSRVHSSDNFLSEIENTQGTANIFPSANIDVW